MGLNGKMLEICAIMGIEQLKSFETAATTRHRCAKRVGDGLAASKVLMSPVRQPARNRSGSIFPCSSTHNASVATATRPRICLPVEYMCASIIARRVIVCPSMCRRAGSLTASQRKPRQQRLALPIYNDMTAGECDRIVEAFRFAQAICNEELR